VYRGISNFGGSANAAGRPDARSGFWFPGPLHPSCMNTDIPRPLIDHSLSARLTFRLASDYVVDPLTPADEDQLLDWDARSPPVA